MGVSLYPMTCDNESDQTFNEDLSMSYSTLQRLRQSVILVCIKYLESELSASDKIIHKNECDNSSSHKKIKLSNSDDVKNNQEDMEVEKEEEGVKNSEDEDVKNNEEESENDEEEEEKNKMLRHVLDSIRTWCVPEPPKSIYYDSTKHSLSDLVGQLSQMVPIKYDKINSTCTRGSDLEDDLFRLDLIGLLKFVNHSDCQGYHSKGDCIDIYETLHKNEKYANCLQDEDGVELYKECVEFFKQIVEHRMGVLYC